MSYHIFHNINQIQHNILYTYNQHYSIEMKYKRIKIK